MIEDNVLNTLIENVKKCIKRFSRVGSHTHSHIDKRALQRMNSLMKSRLAI